MSEQLSLFNPLTHSTSGEAAQAADAACEGDANAIDELFRTTGRWRERSEYVDLLEFIARFPGYSPLNGFLLFLQDPAATVVATAKAWSRKYARRLRPGARPLTILAPMSPVLFVYDIRDTEGPALPAGAFRSAAGGERLRPKLYENTLNNCRLQRIAVRETPRAADMSERTMPVTPAARKQFAELNLEAHSRFLVLLAPGSSLEQKYAGLIRELGHIFCGHLGIDGDAWWSDHKDLDPERIDLQAESTAFLVCRRAGLSAPGRLLANDTHSRLQTFPPFSLNSVLQAVGHIEEMGRVQWKKFRRRGR